MHARLVQGLVCLEGCLVVMLMKKRSEKVVHQDALTVHVSGYFLNIIRTSYLTTFLLIGRVLCYHNQTPNSYSSNIHRWASQVQEFTYLNLATVIRSSPSFFSFSRNGHFYLGTSRRRSPRSDVNNTKSKIQSRFEVYPSLCLYNR